ncbi:integral membrane protein [Lactiplantibacillus plantarum]|nr:integral membrane protein [Lactiplantibacillus plantarum]MCG0867559.1 integral membrane protein [Lactiplantibacillus plantarum]
MAKEKHEIYDEQDKRLGRLILKILGIVAIVSGLVGPFIYLLNANWGRELGTLAVS